MCFGNNEKQSNYSPRGNNYCGGFALDAVLTDVNSIDPDPIGTYEKIQEVQNDNMMENSKSQQFIEASKESGKGTVMLLPSSIAREAENRDLKAKVYYAPSVKLSFKGIMDEELDKLENMAMEIEMNEDDFWDEVNKKAADSIYFIVLVDKSHWVAVKKIDENNFICYDPADGSCTGKGSNIPKAIKSDYTVNKLVIALKKQ